MRQSSVEIVPYPAVNAAIFNSEGNILLTRRSKLIREPGKWCLPGGHLDGGESWVEAVRRETKEEVGLQIVKEQLVGIYSDPVLTVTDHPLEKGHYGQFLVALFLVTHFHGEVAPNHEVDAWDWFSPGDLPKEIIKSHPIRVKDAFSFKGEVFVR